MNTTVKIILRLAGLIVAQVLIVNHIRLGGYVHPYIYMIFIILLPINMPKIPLLLTGFSLGLVIDLFMGTLGLHAATTTLIAFCRPAIIRIISGSQKLDNIYEPTIEHLGFPWFLRYTLCIVILHHFALFLLESFSFRLMGQELLRILLSTPVSIFLILIILYLFKTDKKKND